MSKLTELESGRNLMLPPPPTEYASAIPALPEHLAHSGMSMTQLLTIMRAYRLQLVIISVTLIALASLAIKFIPKTYVASTTMIVNLETRDPLAGRDFPVEMIASYVATQTELMQSDIVLLPVVDKLKLTEDKDFVAGFSGNRAALREFVAKRLATQMWIDNGRGGQLLYIQTMAHNADKAAVLANAIADAYIEQDRRRANSPATERAERYTQELAELRQKTIAAQDKVTQFRKDNGISEISASSADTEIQTLTNLQERLLETQNKRRALEAKLIGQQAASDEVLASDPLQTLHTTLDTQQAQLAELRETYGPKHPKIQELQSQIALTKEALARESGSLSANVRTELERTKDLEKKYTQAVAEQQAKVLALRQSQDQGAKLLLELESAQTVYKHALDGFDQIAFSAAANHTNISIVARAVPPLQAAKPNKLKLLGMAVFAGLGAGIVGPLLYELFLHRRIRCRDDIERGFHIPVLAQLET